MTESWEIKASRAKSISRNAPSRKFRELKKDIMSKIKCAAEDGCEAIAVSCPDRNHAIEITSWLKNLDYDVTYWSDDGSLDIHW